MFIFIFDGKLRFEYFKSLFFNQAELSNFHSNHLRIILETKLTVGIISITYLNKEHILNARNEAEGMLLINNAHFYPEKCTKSIKCRNYTLGDFFAEA